MLYVILYAVQQLYQGIHDVAMTASVKTGILPTPIDLFLTTDRLLLPQR